MCKISDKSDKFLLNYSNLLRCPLCLDTVYVTASDNSVISYQHLSGQ